MIAAPRAIGIELVRLYAVRDQIFSRRRIERRSIPPEKCDRWSRCRRERPARARHEYPREPRRFRHVFKIRRQLDVCGLRIPLVQIAFGNRHGFPVRVAFEHVGVFFASTFRWSRIRARLFQFPAAWARSRGDRPACRGIRAQRFRGKIHIHAAGERIGHDQRRRSQIICAHQRMNAPFKISIAAQNRDRHHIVVLDRRANRLRASGPLLPMQVVQP